MYEDWQSPLLGCLPAVVAVLIDADQNRFGECTEVWILLLFYYHECFRALCTNGSSASVTQM